MTFTQLEYFMKTCETGSISKAAEQLMVSRTAVSKMIVRIEEELGQTLFERTKEGVSTTEAGAYLYGKISVLYKGYADLLRQVQGMSFSGEQTLKIGVIVTNINELYDFILRDFCETHRNIKVELVEGKWNEVSLMLAKGDVDVAFFPIRGDSSRAEERYPEYAKVKLFSNRLFLAVSPDHPYASKRIISVDDLLGVPLGYLSGATPGEGMVTSVCRAVTGNEPEIVLKTSSHALLHRLTREGRLCTLLPRNMAGEWSDLAIRPLNVTADVYHYMCWRKSENMSAALIDFVNYVYDNFDRLMEEE